MLNESSNKFKCLLNCLSTMAIFGNSLGCVLVLQYKHGHRWLFNRGMHSTDRQLPPFRKSVVTTWPSPAKTGLCLFLKGKGFVYTWPQSQTLLPMQVEWNTSRPTWQGAWYKKRDATSLAPRQSGNAARTSPAQEILAVFEYCLKIQMGNLLLYTHTPDNQNLPPWIAYPVAL